MRLGARFKDWGTANSSKNNLKKKGATQGQVMKRNSPRRATPQLCRAVKRSNTTDSTELSASFSSLDTTSSSPSSKTCVVIHRANCRNSNIVSLSWQTLCVLHGARFGGICSSGSKKNDSVWYRTSTVHHCSTTHQQTQSSPAVTERCELPFGQLRLYSQTSQRSEFHFHSNPGTRQIVRMSSRVAARV